MTGAMIALFVWPVFAGLLACGILKLFIMFRQIVEGWFGE